VVSRRAEKAESSGGPMIARLSDLYVCISRGAIAMVLLINCMIYFLSGCKVLIYVILY
jgi:hypothetical protein